MTSTSETITIDVGDPRGRLPQYHQGGARDDDGPGVLYIPHRGTWLTVGCLSRAEAEEVVRRHVAPAPLTGQGDLFATSRR